MEGRDQPLLAFCHFFKWTPSIYGGERESSVSRNHRLIGLITRSTDTRGFRGMSLSRFKSIYFPTLLLFSSLQKIY